MKFGEKTMEESSEILLNSLANSGISLPPGVSSIPDLTPSTLFSVCSQCLRLISQTPLLATSLPEDSMSERVRLCTDLASAFTSLGFIGDISFHKFLYPSEEDLYKLVRFLAERLPGNDQEFNDASTSKFEILEAAHSGSEQHGPGAHQKVNTLDQDSFEKILSLLSEEELLRVELNRRSSELQDLCDEYDLLKSATEMAIDGNHPISFYQEQISDQVQVKRQNLLEAESQWEATKASMEEKRIGLEESVAAKLPEAYKKLQEVKEIESEIKQRDEELMKLHSDLEKQPKLAPRKFYIERIKEITKNSRKQDTDIERILKDTRELQLESNSIQERLHRTYSVVDETVFREAKKDPGGKQIYRLLASIHVNFEQMAEKILSADRTRREVADYEAKLAAITSRSLNLDKLKADLDAIRKENELLEQRVNHI